VSQRSGPGINAAFESGPGVSHKARKKLGFSFCPARDIQQQGISKFLFCVLYR
jgi:hypothetical protein